MNNTFQLRTYVLPLIIAAAFTGFAENNADYLKQPLPEHWSYVPEHPMEVPSAINGWWTTFNDTLLDTLVQRGLDVNYDVSAALHRSNAARAAMGQARAAWFPSVSASAGWTAMRSSGLSGPVAGNAITDRFFSAGLNASWEVDIFGRIAKGVEAKRASYRASRAEWAGAMVSITAQIASQYVQIRMLQEQLDVANAHLATQQKIVDIAKARYEATLSSKLDVAQAEETYYSTASTIPNIENSLHHAVNALSVLTGIDARQLHDMLVADSTSPRLPEAVQMVGAGVPADLLRRRPDIVQAEMNVSELAAMVGVAKKDFLPTLTINGAIGTSARNFSDLAHKNSFTYSVEPTLSWTLFDGFGRKYALSQAREQMKAAIDNYNLTVLNAVSEADNAMSTYFHSVSYMDAISRIITANNEVFRLAVDRYKNSLTPMSDVVMAQINALQAESELIRAHGSALSALISLYEALGGGYDVAHDTP